MEPILIDTKTAKQMLGVGTTKLYELMADGSVKFVKVGRSTLFRPADLRSFADSLPYGEIENLPHWGGNKPAA